MHMDTTDHIPPAPTVGDVSDATLDRAGVSRTAVRAADAFFALMAVMGDHLRATADRLGMSPPLLLVLRMLDQPLAQRDIAASISCDPSYVTTLVDRLEELGAVRRTPDPDDRRVNRIVLTAAGEQLRRDVVVGLLRDLPLARGLDEGELRQLHGLLDLAQVVSTAGWRVRAPRDADAEDLFALVGGVFAEYEGCVLDEDGLDADLHAWASHLLERGGRGWVVLDDSGRIVACVGVTPTAQAPGPAADVEDVVELKRLYVAARARRRGLGRALVARVEHWARAHGADAVVLWSDTRFTDAHRLYARLGYDQLDLRRQLHDPSDTTEAAFVRLLPDVS